MMMLVKDSLQALIVKRMRKLNVNLIAALVNAAVIVMFGNDAGEL